MAELENPDVAPPPRRQMVARRSNAGLAVGFALLVAAAGAYVYWRTHQPAPAPVVAAPAPAPVAAPVAAADPDELPADAQKVDPAALLKQLATSLSARPELASWLGEAKLIQRLTAAVNMVANGENPHPLLAFLAPGVTFTTDTVDGKLRAAAASHARYDTFTQVITSIDPGKAGAAYAQVAPYFQRAFREIARPGERFTPVLHAAIARLRETPVPDAEPELQEKGAVYLYADPALENLKPAQKQLLRMGAANERALQAWLGAFDRALPAR